MHLVLFDIDGTLIATRGAGMRAFYRAIEYVFGIKAGDDTVRPAGKTDPVIVKEVLAHFGLEDQWNNIDARESLWDIYLVFLEDEMSMARREGRLRVLPGVIDLLSALSCQSDFAVGIATGNLKKGADIKLSQAGLRGYFKFGGYGSDSEDRTELIRIAIRRGIETVAPKPVKNAIVIGDTPLDIIHGRAAGARVIAVSNTGYSMDELCAYNPDLLVSDLTQVDCIISFMRKNPPGQHF